MRDKKKKSIKDLETELEQLIATSGQSEDDIHNDFNDYCTLKTKIDNPNSRNDDDDIQQMNWAEGQTKNRCAPASSEWAHLTFGCARAP
jgi:hypothetical protein